jgi:TRAP-type C4-dicarboxylate transport system substrate-binding protein
VDPKLVAYAKAHAGKPGAVYAGRLEDLVGPTVDPAMGDADGNVTLSSIQKWSWIFTSDYYKVLLKKARVDNPTPLVTQGKKFKIQFACINRALTWCKLADQYLAPNLLERTGGQVEIKVVGFPELGIAGPDTVALLADGTLSLAELGAAYVAGDMPALEVKYLWGIYQDHETFYKASAAVIPDLDRLVSERTGGGVTISHVWRVGENNIFMFTKKPIRTLEDIKGLKIRSFGGAMSDWIEGMGASAQFVAFSEVYTAIERGILDGGVSGANAAYGQRWYEVAKHMTGPLPLFTTENVTFNKKVWDGFPPDIQQIIIEEGAKFDLELFRMAPIQGEVGVPKLVAKGMEYNEFSPEIKAYMLDKVALGRVVPNWVKRTGGPDSEAVKLFNEKVGPLVGLKINPDGSVSKVPVTK